MAVEARSRLTPAGLRRTAPNRSLASVPLSRASSSSTLKSEMITSPYPLQGRDVVLDLESRKRYEELRIDIRKLGGRIVDTINEEKLPFVVISDHPTATRLETMKGMYSKNTRVGDLPMLLKEAVRCHVKVRSYVTFQEQFTRFKARIRAAKSLSNAPQKRLSKVDEAPKGRRIRRLKRPFIKWQDSRKDHAPSYKECPTPRWTTVYFGPAAGNCVFRRVTAEQLEKRKQRENEALIEEDSDPPSSPGRERSAKSWKSVKNRTVKTPTNKFCDLCGKTFEDMEEHYESREHAVTATRPGVYDEVDMCTGAVVDYVICPAAPSFVRLPEIVPEEDEPVCPEDGTWDYEYSEGNYECTLLNTSVIIEEGSFLRLSASPSFASIWLTDDYAVKELDIEEADQMLTGKPEYTKWYEAWGRHQFAEREYHFYNDVSSKGSQGLVQIGKVCLDQNNSELAERVAYAEQGKPNYVKK